MYLWLIAGDSITTVRLSLAMKDWEVMNSATAEVIIGLTVGRAGQDPRSGTPQLLLASREYPEKQAQ